MKYMRECQWCNSIRGAVLYEIILADYTQRRYGHRNPFTACARCEPLINKNTGMKLV